MARFLEVGILVLALAFTTEGFSLEDRLQLQQLTENYVQLREVLAAKDARLEALEVKVQEQESKVIRLEATVQKQQEQLLIALQNKMPTSSAEFVSSSLVSNGKRSAERIMFPRTCREVRAADPSLSSGMHWIDPDGQGVGDDPIYVYCDMTKGTTLVLHDSEASIDVGHCADPGCYSRTINYNATMRQMAALADLSSECHQSIQYDCNYAPFQFDGVTYSWWNDNKGKSQIFWTGNNASVHTCQCGIDHNCVDATTTCNCDSTAPVPLTDSGIITDKNYLPITRLNFGRTQLASSSGVHTLGRFECSGQVAVSGMPKSCADLWQIGHFLSGLYSVMGSTQVESVYCDFTKLPTDSGSQSRIGYVDVKSSPVYFDVQRNTDFNTTRTPIPFERENLNVGGAMNLSSGIFTAPRDGIYFFSFFGLAQFSPSSSRVQIQVDLYVNDVSIATGWADEISSGPEKENEPCAVQSTLHLQAGDRVWVQSSPISPGAVLRGDRNTYFTGWLLEEDISQLLKVAY